MPLSKSLLRKETKISGFGKISHKELKEEFYSEGPIATTHVDTVGDKITKDTLEVWAEDINSTSDLDANPVSIHHERQDTTLAGLGVNANVEATGDGEFGLFVKTHHNKSHEDFENTKYQVENNFLSHYSIEYDTNEGATTHRENIDGKWVRVIEPETELLGYGFASPRTVVNKQAKIESAGFKEEYKELFRTEQKQSKTKTEVKKMPETKKSDTPADAKKKKAELEAAKKEETPAAEEKPAPAEDKKAEDETTSEEEKTAAEGAKEIASGMAKLAMKEMKEQIKKELKETKPENAPMVNQGGKVENKEKVESKEAIEFKEIHAEFKEKVLGKKGHIDDQYRIAAKLENSFKERGLRILNGDDLGIGAHGNMPFEIKENKIELKDVRVETDPAGTTTSDYPSILANYEQSPARFNDIYGPVIVNHLNEMNVTWNRLTKENMTGMSAIRIRARTARNAGAGTFAYGSTPSFTTNVAIKKLNLHFVTSFVPVQLEDEAIEFARAPGGIGDAFAVEVRFSTLDLMDNINQSGIYGSGDGTLETAPLGLDGGLIRTSGNLYGKDVTAGGFTTLAAAGRDAMGGAKITLKKMRDMIRGTVVNGARQENLAFFTSWLQYHFIYALIQDMQRIVPTSTRVGFTGLAELDGVPIFPDPDLDDASMTDDLFLLDVSATKIGLKKAPTFVEFGKVSLHRRGIIWMMWNLFSEAPNRNYQLQGLATS